MTKLFDEAANTNASLTKSPLSAFEETLFNKFTEFHSKGYVAFAVFLIRDKNDNGLMTYMDPRTNRVAPCSYDFAPIAEGANPHAVLENLQKASCPVVLAMDLISKGSNPRKQMPEGWTPGSIVFPSALQDNPVISLAPEETYTTRAKKQPESDDSESPDTQKKRARLRLVISNP